MGTLHLIYTELLARIARFAYGKFPYCTEFTTLGAQLDFLCMQIGFDEPERFSTNLKKYNFFFTFSLLLDLNLSLLLFFKSFFLAKSLVFLTISLCTCLKCLYFSSRDSLRLVIQSQKRSSKNLRHASPTRGAMSANGVNYTDSLVRGHDGKSSSRDSESSDRYSFHRDRKMSSRKILQMLDDDDALEDRLQRIFIFYCSFGDHLNTDLMSSLKFSRFCKDIGILDRRSLSQGDVDILFLQIVRSGVDSQQESPKSTPRKPSQQSRKTTTAALQPKMEFSTFMEAINVLGMRLCHPLPLEEARRDFLMKYVLPKAGCVEPLYTKIDFFNSHVQDSLRKYRNALRLVCRGLFIFNPPPTMKSLLVSLFFSLFCL